MLARGVIVLHKNAHPYCPEHVVSRALEGVGPHTSQTFHVISKILLSVTHENVDGSHIWVGQSGQWFRQQSRE